MTGFLITALIAFILWILFKIINKSFIMWSAEKIVNKMLTNPSEGHSKEISLENPKYGIIEIYKDGFQIRNIPNKEKTSIEWNEIASIFAYKKDLFTTDMVCLGWKLIRTDEMIETHEEMIGFRTLCEVMIDKYKTCL